MVKSETTQGLTGRHVLIAFILFFGVVIVTDFVFVRLAVTSFPGEQVEKSYYQGLNYNEKLAEKRRQAATGWSIQLVSTPQAGLAGDVEVRLSSSSGRGIEAAEVAGQIVRPMTDEGLQELAFVHQGDGIYVARANALGRGVWDLSIEAIAEGDDEPSLTATTRISVR